MITHGSGPGKLRISSDGIVGNVQLDGQDVSHALAGLKLRMAAGELPQATLDVLVHDLSTEVEARVVIPQETRDLLVRLGWTPPAEEATS